ncbi:sensor histidine kinase [Fundidesulfovibrio soli]|uniref:sensor histidine kinase n=1 Tax=Fundidesulfovibrio soli TaxID=2922716 RepID=UPI001FAFD9A8|nr:7TM diverse intracellular signaling domain-containing protein [Fundidesulfovibrio soli]
MKARNAVLACAVLAALLCCGCVSGPGAPRAAGGVLDLSGMGLAGGGPVRLDGEWELYWNQLLQPDDFRSGLAGGERPSLTGYLELPSAWNAFEVEGKPLPSAGCATLRLVVLPGAAKQELAVRLASVNSASSLWVNGRLCAQSGIVSRSAEAEVPKPSVLLAAFPAEGGPLELVLQISNHSYREAGVLAPVRIGPRAAMEAAQTRQWCVALFFVGSLLVMGVYHLALFWFRRSNRSPLYFGCYCLAWMVNYAQADSSDWVARLFLPDVSAALMDRISVIGFIVSVPIGFTFFRTLYPLEFPRLPQLACSVLAAAFALATAALPMMAASTVLPAYYSVSIGLIIYCLCRLFTAWRRGREGAAFILWGFLVLGVVGINDMLADMGLIHSVYLLPVGMFVFILFQAFALSLRFSRAFASVERLSVELERKNDAVEREMAERARLERRVVDISEEERRRLSHDLHDGLCQQLTGARLRCEVLTRKTPEGDANSRELRQLAGLLEESVNQAYDLSCGLWPVEHGPGGNGPSLEELVRRTAAASGIAIEFSQRRGCGGGCRNGLVTQLYRIGQEAMANAVKHASPGRIQVEFACREGGSVTLTVRDDGIGRSAAARGSGGLGMGIMAHRARIIGAELTVEDAPGGGTLVRCTAPCRPAGAEG